MQYSRQTVYRNSSSDNTFKTIHRTQFRCDICGKQFTETHHLIAHLKLIHGTQFKCDSPAKQFSQTRHLIAQLEGLIELK